MNEPKIKRVSKRKFSLVEEHGNKDPMVKIQYVLKCLTDRTEQFSEQIQNAERRNERYEKRIAELEKCINSHTKATENHISQETVDDLSMAMGDMRRRMDETRNTIHTMIDERVAEKVALAAFEKNLPKKPEDEFVKRKEIGVAIQKLATSFDAEQMKAKDGWTTAVAAVQMDIQAIQKGVLTMKAEIVTDKKLEDSEKKIAGQLKQTRAALADDFVKEFNSGYENLQKRLDAGLATSVGEIESQFSAQKHVFKKHAATTDKIVEDVSERMKLHSNAIVEVSRELTGIDQNIKNLHLNSDRVNHRVSIANNDLANLATHINFDLGLHRSTQKLKSSTNSRPKSTSNPSTPHPAVTTGNAMLKRALTTTRAPAKVTGISPQIQFNSANSENKKSTNLLDQILSTPVSTVPVSSSNPKHVQPSVSNNDVVILIDDDIPRGSVSYAPQQSSVHRVLSPPANPSHAHQATVCNQIAVQNTVNNYIIQPGSSMPGDIPLVNGTGTGAVNGVSSQRPNIIGANGSRPHLPGLEGMIQQTSRINAIDAPPKETHTPMPKIPRVPVFKFNFGDDPDSGDDDMPPTPGPC